VVDCLNVRLTGPNDLANGLPYAHLYWLQIQFDGPAASGCRHKDIYTHMFACKQKQLNTSHRLEGKRGKRGETAAVYKWLRVWNSVKLFSCFCSVQFGSVLFSSVQFSCAAMGYAIVSGTPRRMRYNNMYTYAHKDESKCWTKRMGTGWLR